MTFLDSKRTALNEEISRRLADQYDKVKKRIERKKDGKAAEIALEDEIELLKAFFSPGNNQDPHTFGTVDIDYRIKSLDSIKNNFVRGFRDLDSANDAATIKKVDELGRALTDLLDSDKPSVWCKHLRDFIGVRIIVRSQRNKYQIYRAIRYLCELNQTERRKELDIPFVTTEDDKTWKYFNPPMMRAYYRPVVVQEFHDALRDITSLTAEDQGSERFLHAFTKLDSAKRHGISIEFKNTGYATLQRNLYFHLRDVTYLFELQIRTVLEHAWAEPEHKMIYKGEHLSEHVKGLFRNYGLSLSSADDILQMVMDEWRRDTDYRADYSERSLRIFEHSNNTDTLERSKATDKNLFLLYDNLAYGYVNDAISVAHALVQQQESDSVQQAQFQIEEAVCRMCNVPFAHDDEIIADLLAKSDYIGELHDDSEIRYFARFRKSQYHYLKAESHFVDHMRGDQSTSPNTLDKAQEEMEKCVHWIGRAIEMYELREQFHRGNHAAIVTRVELQIRLARSYEWYAKISQELLKKQNTPQEQRVYLGRIINHLKSAVKAIDGSLELLKGITDSSVRTYNNIDIESYNAKIWCLRLLHECYMRQYEHSHKRGKMAAKRHALEVVSHSKSVFNELMGKCMLEDVCAALRSPSEQESRRQLRELINDFIEIDPYDEDIALKLRDCTMFDLRVLDTAIGYRLICKHSFAKMNASDDVAKKLNNALRARLVRIAAKGDFSFNSYFAYSLLTNNRIH